MLPLAIIQYFCRVIAECFVKSAQAGIDSEDFVEKFMTSKYGREILTNEAVHEYACAGYMFEGLTRKFQFKKGKTYDIDVLYLAGYTYEYWIATRNVIPTYVFKLAPLQLFADRYEFYCTQCYDYIICDITERHYEQEK